MKMIVGLSIGAAIATAATCGNVTASRAYGDAPWCAVINTGFGAIEWDCEYRTAAECAPNVIAGNRGFCNLNPYWRGPPPAAAHAMRQRRHVQQ
jgi:hypothetical protein